MDFTGCTRHLRSHLGSLILQGIEYATEEDELLDKLDGMDIDEAQTIPTAVKQLTS